MREHTVRLDKTSDEEEPKLLFASVPWINFTLVAVKPDGDNDVDHVPLLPCQLPGPVCARARLRACVRACMCACMCACTCVRA